MNDIRQAGRPFLLLLTPLLALGCRRAPEPTSAQADAAIGPSAVRTSDAFSRDGGAATDAYADTSDPPVPLWDGGMWVESDAYDFKVETVKLCKPDKVDDADAKAPNLVGVKVQVKAKVGEFFADQRHAQLRSGGIFLSPKLEVTNFPGCTPAFKPVQLRAGQVTGGFIVFEVPGPYPNLLVEYHPVRWGGAGTVRVKIELPRAP
jgi:hypothetical protein